MRPFCPVSLKHATNKNSEQQGTEALAGFLIVSPGRWANRPHGYKPKEHCFTPPGWIFPIFPLFPTNCKQILISAGNQGLSLLAIWGRRAPAGGGCVARGPRPKLPAAHAATRGRVFRRCSSFSLC